MAFLGRWASFPELDPVDLGSHSCSRIAANSKGSTLLKELKDGFTRNKHTNWEYSTRRRNCSGNVASFKNENIEIMAKPILQHYLQYPAKFHNHRFENMRLNLTPKLFKTFHHLQHLQVPIIFAISLFSFVTTAKVCNKFS